MRKGGRGIAGILASGKALQRAGVDEEAEGFVRALVGDHGFAGQPTRRGRELRRKRSSKISMNDARRSRGEQPTPP